jgi:nucleoid-associated protein EbfC
MPAKPFRKKTTPSKGAPNNPNAVMAQVQQMQTDMAKAQEELEQTYITVTAGGGAISVEISGQQRLRAIKLDPELLNDEDTDIEMVQDMLVAAINSAIEQSQTLAAQRMEEISSKGGLNDMLSGFGLGM